MFLMVVKHIQFMQGLHFAHFVELHKDVFSIQSLNLFIHDYSLLLI